MIAEKTGESGLEQARLERLDHIVVDQRRIELPALHSRQRRLVFFRPQIRQRFGRSPDRRRLESARRKSVVRAMVAASLIDRENLDQLEADRGRPIDEFPQRRSVADAKIPFPAHGKDRDKDAGNGLVERKIHEHLEVGW